MKRIRFPLLILISQNFPTMTIFKKSPSRVGAHEADSAPLAVSLGVRQLQLNQLNWSCRMPSFHILFVMIEFAGYLHPLFYSLYQSYRQFAICFVHSGCIKHIIYIKWLENCLRLLLQQL